MNDQTVILMFKALADKSRIEIIKSLYQEDMYVERLAERIGLSAPTTIFHLKKLLDANIVTSYKHQYYMMYALNRSVFEMQIKELIDYQTTDDKIISDRDTAYEAKIVDSFFKQGKLLLMPVQKKKRQMVLDRVESLFEKDKSYTERDVHLKLADIYDDFTSLKKELILNGNLTINHQGLYVRRNG